MDFPHSCTIAQPTTEDEYHNVSYGTPVTVECRYKEDMEFDLTKNIEVESAWLALPPGTTVVQKSKIVLDNGKQYIASSSILGVERLSDKEIDYIRVILGFPLNGRSLA